MTRNDLIKHELYLADTYRREAARRQKTPRFAAQLISWAEASERRAEALRCGPLFVQEEA